MYTISEKRNQVICDLRRNSVSMCYSCKSVHIQFSLEFVATNYQPEATELLVIINEQIRYFPKSFVHGHCLFMLHIQSIVMQRVKQEGQMTAASS